MKCIFLPAVRKITAQINTGGKVHEDNENMGGAAGTVPCRARRAGGAFHPRVRLCRRRGVYHRAQNVAAWRGAGERAPAVRHGEHTCRRRGVREPHAHRGERRGGRELDGQHRPRAAIQRARRGDNLHRVGARRRGLHVRCHAPAEARGRAGVQLGQQDNTRERSQLRARRVESCRGE